MQLSNEERLRLLERYVNLEPEIVVNTEPFVISYQYDEQGVWFYAVSRFSHCAQGIYLMSKHIWETLNCGLTMAVVYDMILSVLERRVLAA